MHGKPQYPPVTLAGTEVRTLASKAVEGMEYKILITSIGRDGNASETLPVVYVLDGWAFFGTVTETCRMLRFSGEIQPVLIVGISWEGGFAEHAYNRARDFYPTYISPEELVEKRGPQYAYLVPTSGGAASFLRFLQEELFPFVEQEYGGDPSDRGLFGYSAGGTFVSWVLFNTPQVFQRYMIGSPALYWDDGLIHKHEAAYAERQSELPAKVFLSVGDAEEDEAIAHVDRLKNTMQARDYGGLDLVSRVFEGETHASGIPATFSRALCVLYGS
jgi:predicted alpha/beta superfamily hydrolase